MSLRLRIVTVSTLLISAFGCAGGTDSKPTWVEAPDVDIPAYTTFGWADRSGVPPATILDNQIRDAVRAQLVAKGYMESSQTPDFLVDHETIEKDAVEKGNPVRIGIGVGSWGRNVGGSVGTSVDVGGKDQVVPQLRVTVRALDPEHRREIWVGNTTPLAERPEADAINNAVAGLMKAFPGKRP